LFGLFAADKKLGEIVGFIQAFFKLSYEF